MLFKQLYDDDLAQASYLIGDQTSGTAMVVDPRRDIRVYLETAEQEGLRITAVADTHIHADYLSGARELALATEATLYLSDEGGPDWQYDFEHTGLRDGQQIAIGSIKITALHTPGHTPEHLSFLVSDQASTHPGLLLSGDFVFVGDVGRPDLLDEAAGGVDTRFAGARQLFSSIKHKFLTLADDVQVWPGHGAGSACGKTLGAAASSTVGHERQASWWATHLNHDDEAGFTQNLLYGQPDAPSYFGRMKHQNKTGPAILGHRDPLEHLSSHRLRTMLEAGTVLIDTRSREAFQAANLPGSLHLPNTRNFATWASWLLEPHHDHVLFATNAQAASELRDKLAHIGVDRMLGFTTTLEGLHLKPQAPLTLAGFHRLKRPFVLDVRTKSEFEAGHLPQATHIHVGRLLANLERIPRDRPVVVHCQGGARSAAAVSALNALGLSNALDLDGGYEAWLAHGMVNA